MRTIIIVALSFISIALFSQSLEPFRGANAILIDTGLPDSEAYMKLGQNLVTNGYSIDVNNKDFLQLKTDFRSPSDYSFTYSLTVSVSDGMLIIKPAINSGTAVLGIYEWVYNKSRSTKNYVVQQDIIKHLGSLGTVLYEKR